MRLLILFLLSCFISQEIKAEPIRFEIRYFVDFKNIKEKKDFHSDEMILEIGTKRTNFYSYWARLRAERMDSLQKIGITDPWALQAHLGDIPRSFFLHSIYTNYPEAGSRFVYCNHFTPIYYEEKNEVQNWQLVDRDSVIMDYHCQMARCLYRGHNWTVWYATEIPLAAGPWKLVGLPGLILYAADENGCCTFEAVGIEKSSNREMLNPKNNALKSTRKQDAELLKLRYTDVNEYLKRMGLSSGGKIVGIDGAIPKNENRTVILLENE